MPRVTFLPSAVEVDAPVGSSLLDAATSAGVRISAPCGGEGACGECLVRVEKGSVESVARGCLTPDELSGGWALACSTRVVGDVVIAVPEETEEAGAGRVLVEAGDEGHAFRRPLHERHCEPLVAKRLVRVAPPSLENAFCDLERLTQALKPGLDGCEVACGLPVLRELASALRADPRGEVTVSVTRPDRPGMPAHIIRVEPGDTTARSFGIAVDIGTTTCAVHLVNLAADHILGTAGDYNGQRARGHDIISRINYASAAGRLDELRSLVLGTLNTLVGRLCAGHAVRPEELDCAAVVGNTTMVHLLLGMNPDHIRLEPYTPTVNRPPMLRGHETGLAMNPDGVVCFAPGVGSYVGGDITAGILQTALAHPGDEVSLFLDIGTNGEVVVGTGEWMMACAASAGPAFEGYGVGCGMRAAAGAVERVRVEPATGRAVVTVIGGGKPAGICGSGLIDLLSELRAAGILDPSGKLNAALAPSAVGPVPDSSRILQYTVVPAAETADGEAIILTEQDITNLLRAKAAIYSACSLMLKSVGLGFDSVARVYVAGGFGRFLDIRDAIIVGMLPDLPLESYVYLGNSALAGAHALLTSRDARRRVSEIADRLTYLELNADPAYMDEYMAALFMPHTDAHRFPSVAQGGARRDPAQQTVR
jgi:uncharacterized 2Fe-2S/4Fe-4S cluster protein (DUF4445 family)